MLIQCCLVACEIVCPCGGGGGGDVGGGGAGGGGR